MDFVSVYILISLVVAIYLIVSIHFDKGFDKCIHDQHNGLLEFSASDKIAIPILTGLIWPYVIYYITRKIIHG